MRSKKVIAMLLTYAVLLTSFITPAYADNENTAAVSTGSTNQTKDIAASAEAVTVSGDATTQETTEGTTTKTVTEAATQTSVTTQAADTTTSKTATTEASKAKKATTEASKAKSTTSKAKTTTKKTAKKSYTKKELRYMAAIIFCEAGNQSYAGKLAVGIVVKNRMESKKFPSSIKGVLYQPYQFTPTRNGHMSAALRKYDKTGFKTGSAYKSCLKAAKEALSGQKKVVVGGKTRNMKGYYFFSRYVSGCRLRIGAHMFK